MRDTEVIMNQNILKKPFTLEDKVNLNIEVDDQEKMVSKMKNTIETLSKNQKKYCSSH